MKQIFRCFFLLTPCWNQFFSSHFILHSLNHIKSTQFSKICLFVKWLSCGARFCVRRKAGFHSSYFLKRHNVMNNFKALSPMERVEVLFTTFQTVKSFAKNSRGKNT